MTDHDHLDARLRAVGHRASTTEAYGERPPLDLASLPTWPVTEKHDVRAKPSAYRTNVRATIRISTSGTTGKPMPNYRTVGEFNLNARRVAAGLVATLDPVLGIASCIDHNSTAAGMLIERVAQINDWALARLWPWGIAGSKIAAVADDIIEFGANVLLSTPGGLNDLEDGWKTAGTFDRVADQIDTLLVIGAVVTEGMRHRLAKEWEAKVIIVSFGSTELGTFAVGCAGGRLHLLEDTHLLELRRVGEILPLDAGGSGELIVTPLDSEASVLVRYSTGDTVSFVKCGCGNPNPAIVVAGRSDDTVLLHGTQVGPEEIERAVYIDGAASDYMVEVDEDDNVLTVVVLPAADTDPSAIVACLGVPVRLVDRLSVLARAGGAVKSWKATRTVTIIAEDD